MMVRLACGAEKDSGATEHGQDSAVCSSAHQLDFDTGKRDAGHHGLQKIVAVCLPPNWNWVSYDEWLASRKGKI